jgi:hypothetical protein
MKLRRTLIAMSSAALLALSACATPFTAQVSRFQTMPPPAGQSFFITPHDPHRAGSLEFASYAKLVSDHLASLGYQPAASPQAATLAVMIDYGVGRPRERVTTTPGFGAGFGPGWGWGRFGGFGRWGRWGGWGDPFWDYPDVESYTVYDSHLDMEINRAADGQRLFEGHARTNASTDDLTRLVPGLVEAMFRNFPGQPAENIRVTIPPAPPKR